MSPALGYKTLITLPSGYLSAINDSQMKEGLPGCQTLDPYGVLKEQVLRLECCISDPEVSSPAF